MSDMDFDVPSESEEEDSDWLKGLRGNDPTPETGLSADESTDPESDAGSSQDVPAGLPAPEEDEGVPDLMADGDAGEASQTESQSEEEAEPPDWLGSIREAEKLSQVEESDAVPGPDDNEDDGEWLNRIREREEERVATEVPVEQEDVPFMDRIQSLEASKEPGADDAKEQQSPDFLSGLPADQEPTQPGEDESPDWLSGLLVSPPSPPEDSTSAEAELVEEDSHSTGDDLESSEGIPTINGDQDQAALPGEAEHPAIPEDSGFIDTGSLPSWLADMKRTGSLDEAALSSDTPSSIGEEESSSPAEELIDLELTPGDLPDWLTEPSSEVEQAEEILADVEETESKGIASADMPKWLDGMRPVDSPYAPVEGGDGVEETVGPLAGLQDVIPAEPQIVQFGKPPVYSLNLEISDSQQHNAELFERIIAADSQTQKSKTKALALTQGALRWAIAGLLFVSLLVPILTESTSISLPAAIPPDETLLFQSLVKELDQDDTVLVAFDYQPGLAGEMHAAASAVFDHLLLRGAQLVLVSTQPTGPILGERFLAQTQAAQHRYVAEKSYRNLGYFSGGNIALLNLAQDPHQALPVAITIGETDQSAWDLPPLQNINSISDFGMLIVLTDDPGIARSWIEQVQPSLGGTPLTMIISAQAEPLVRPYFQSDPKKVNGFVAGILGGAYYEQSIGREHLARLYWNSYSAGLGVAVFVIFLGSLSGIASYLLSRRNPSASEVQA